MSAFIIETSRIPANGGLAVSGRGAVPMPKDYSHGVTGAAADVCFSVTVNRVSGDLSGRFTVTGRLEAAVPVLCSVCQNETSWCIEAEISEIFAREPQDIDDWPVKDGVMDLSQAFLANIITAMPIRITCEQEARDKS